jgi:YbbR domain-containing protein
MNLQDNMALAYPPPSTISVLLEGKAINLIHLKFNRTARIEIDLKNMPLGNSRISTERISFVSPSIPNLRMLQVQNATMLNFELDSRIEKNVPVVSKVQAHTAHGFAFLGEPRIIPDSIRISGARSAVANVKSILTEETSINELKWNNSLPVKLNLSLLSSIVEVADTSVFVLVQVEPLDSKIFSDIPVRLIGNFDREAYSLLPSKAEVEVSGGKELINKIDPHSINLYIEFSRFFIENVEELGPTVHIPYHVANWQIHPNKFRLQETAKTNEGED